MTNYTVTAFYHSWYNSETGEEHTEEAPCRFECSCGTSLAPNWHPRREVAEHVMDHVDDGHVVTVEGDWATENDI